MSEVSSFRVHCLNFYVELSEQISKRFTGLSDIFPLLKALDPAVARETGMESLVPLFTNFPQLINESEYDEVNDEWKSLNFFNDVLSTSEHPVEFWCSVKKIKSSDGSLVFKKLGDFLLSLLVLPHSSAAVERIFSQVKLIKTDIRNILNTETVNGLLLTKGNGGTVKCFDWEPSNAMICSAQASFKGK